MSRIGVVTGSRAEARCLPRDPGPVACSGADAKRACCRAEALVEERVRALVSFGLAGALGVDLRAGALLLPEAVITPDGGRIEVDPAWRLRLDELARGARLDVRSGSLAGSRELLDSPAAKAELQRRSGALAVDMESHAVALAAHAAGLPFVVIRAVADAADQALPQTARVALDSDGRLRPGALAAALVRRPGDLPALLRLARASRAGLRTLRRVAVLAGRALALG